MTNIISKKCQNHVEFKESLDNLCNTQWKQSHRPLIEFFYDNKNFFYHPPQDQKLAKTLQRKMYQLSNKINEKFDTPEAHKFAFEIMGYAKGMFNSDKTPHMDSVPQDVLTRCIFTLLLKDYYPNSQVPLPMSLDAIISENRQINEHQLHHYIFPKLKDLIPMSLVAPKWNRSAKSIENNLISGGSLSPKSFGCTTAKQAVQFIIDRKLTSANLEDFPDLDEEDLNLLVKNCPDIDKLIIAHNNIISEDKLAEALKSLRLLKSLTLRGCPQIVGEKLAEALKLLSHLETLDLFYCMQFKGGNAFSEALKSLKCLKRLYLSYNKQFKGGDEFAEALKSLTSLEQLYLGFCKQFQGGDKFAEALKSLNNTLKTLELQDCKQIKEDELIKLLKPLTCLEELDIRTCSIDEHKVAELLRPLEGLKKVNLTAISSGYDAIELLESEFPQIKIITEGYNTGDDYDSDEADRGEKDDIEVDRGEE